RRVLFGPHPFANPEPGDLTKRRNRRCGRLARMKSTNRRWQNHLRAKGPVAFFLDRLAAHALSSPRQFDQGPFHFPIDDREHDDELTRAYFALTEAFPYEVYIEITNRCNLSCRMCARDQMTRPTGIMGNRLFRKIVDE